MTKNKKTILIIVHIVLVLILAIFIFRCVLTGESYRKELSHSYARSLGDLAEYLSDMENTLSKAKYVSTATGQAGVAAALEGAGGGAKAAMSYLPFSAENSAQIEKSISVLSDFALFVGRKSAEGEALSPEDYEAFETLSEHVKKMGEALSDIREKTASGKISLGDTQRVLAKTLNFPAATPFDDGISRVAKELSALPTLLYDGPFSDHIEKRE
ncbi:MAG: germination protein YpeB, partial [Oscillospiraceae bacterium]